MAKKKKHKKDMKKQPDSSNVKNLFQGIWAVIMNKQDTKDEFTKKTLTLLMWASANIIASLLGLTSVLGVCVAIYEGINTFSWNSISACINNLSVFVLFLPFMLILFLFAIMLRGFANEIEKEENRDYIVAIFSGIVSFAALIISLVALIRG